MSAAVAYIRDHQVVYAKYRRILENYNILRHAIEDSRLTRQNLSTLRFLLEQRNPANGSITISWSIDIASKQKCFQKLVACGYLVGGERYEGFDQHGESLGYFFTFHLSNRRGWNGSKQWDPNTRW